MVGFLSMTSDPRVHAQGWGLTSNSSTCSKCGISVSKFSRSPYLDKHLSGLGLNSEKRIFNEKMRKDAKRA